jgi:hypothetical protein
VIVVEQVYEREQRAIGGAGERQRAEPPH